MARVELISAAYAGKSVIASGQECVNLYAEINKQDPQAPAKVTYYPTPGTTLFSSPQTPNNARGAYRTSMGTAFYVVGSTVYFLNQAATLIVIGIIADRESQVYFADNGIVCVFVDGVNGYVIDLETNSLSIITDPNFYGADFVVLLDTFFVFNRPLTNQFYISASNADYGMLTNSSISTGSITNGGTGYQNGTYNNVPLSGGSGTGAIGSFTVAGGVVTTGTITDPGQGYIVGDVLTTNNTYLGGVGTGFLYTVTATLSAFDPLDIAAKSGFSDPIVAIVAVHGELWLIGSLTSEIWIGTGAADFYFQKQQGAFVDHGCAAPYSTVTMDVLVFFIMQDKQGAGIVVQGEGYALAEISTPRIVQEFRSYETLADAIGFTFQIEDHAFYAIVFPTANKGWLYDITTKQWCEWNWTDENGNFLRPRANCAVFVYNNNLVGDWENGKLLKLDARVYMDEDSPIVHVRTFPHMVNNNNKTFYDAFSLDMEVGGIADAEETPKISLEWSDDKGVTYGNPVMQSMGKIGQYLTVPSWNRLGMARDRVFKVSWSVNSKTALNGGFVETTKGFS